MEFVKLEPTFGFPENFPGKVTNDPENKKTIKFIRDTITVKIVQKIIAGHGELFQYVKTNTELQKKIAIYAINPTAVRMNPISLRTFTLFETNSISPQLKTIILGDVFENDRCYNHAFFVQKILKFCKKQAQEMLKWNTEIVDISGIILYEAIQQEAGIVPFNFPTINQETAKYIKENTHLHNIDYNKINWKKCHLINNLVAACLEGLYFDKIHSPESLRSLITGSEIKKVTEVKIPTHYISEYPEIKKTKKECILF